MAKRETLESGSEAEENENSEQLSYQEEEEEEEIENGSNSNVKKSKMAEYEKERIKRMAQNKARMEALGLGKLASSLMGSNPNSSLKSSQPKGKRKLLIGDDDDDEDYKSLDDDYNDDDDDDEDDDDEDFMGSHSSSKSRTKKVKKKSSPPKKKVPVQKHFSSADYIDEEDDELMQAIALSLQDSEKGTTPPKGRQGSAHSQEDAGRRKRKKSFSSRVKMTEDELILHFFQFDEAGREVITIKDLKRVATAHDFTWTDMELANMIHLFDSDRDGKLNLEDFRKIVGRCNMIQESKSN